MKSKSHNHYAPLLPLDIQASGRVGGYTVRGAVSLMHGGFKEIWSDHRQGLTNIRVLYIKVWFSKQF
jgi:hypothetical protein